MSEKVLSPQQLIELNLKGQKESAEHLFKQESRRTALQLSARLGFQADQTIREADKLYQWLIDVK